MITKGYKYIFYTFENYDTACTVISLEQIKKLNKLNKFGLNLTIPWTLLVHKLNPFYSNIFKKKYFTTVHFNTVLQ